MNYLHGTTPLGDMTLFEERGRLVALVWGSLAGGTPSALLEAAWATLDAFLNGQRSDFPFPIRLAGTPFQTRVWARLAAIPYGTTMTYGALALDLATSARAVAAACAANPLPIVIPCHRVVGRDGALTGYSGAGGIDTKERLLALEGAHVPGSPMGAIAPASR